MPRKRETTKLLQDYLAECQYHPDNCDCEGCKIIWQQEELIPESDDDHDE